MYTNLTKYKVTEICSWIIQTDLKELEFVLLCFPKYKAQILNANFLKSSGLSFGMCGYSWNVLQSYLCIVKSPNYNSLNFKKYRR